MNRCMVTFKQFLTELKDLPFLVSMVDKLAQRTPRPYLYCDYDGTLHEGFIEGARMNNVDVAMIEYKMWSSDEGTHIPAVLFIYAEDVDRFYVGKFDGRTTLLCRPPSSDEQVTEERKIYAKKIENAPEWAPQHAEDSYRIGDITFSSRDGLGSVPINANIWYEGFVALMTPSTFLTLALDDEGHQEPTSQEIEKLVREGYAVGVPFLEIAFDPDGNELPRIKGHEGRGRMRMIRRVLGDVPVPVHFLLRGGLRSRDLTPAMTDEVKIGLFAERSDRLVRRPVKKIWVNGKEV